MTKTSNPKKFDFDKFIIIPEKIYSNENLSDIDKLVFGLILSLSSQRNYCFASNTTLGNKLNKSTTTISRSISELKNQEFITIKKPKSGQRQIFIQHHNLESDELPDLSISA